MKIAVISDTHLGYARFREDSFRQAEEAIVDACKKTELIIHAGDVFDTKVPTFETIHEALNVFRKATKPLVCIYGNHERRSKDMVNPMQLLAHAGAFIPLHANEYCFGEGEEKVQIFGVGNVPEEFARTAILAAVKRFVPKEGHFKILIIHQSIKELIMNAKEEISLDDLGELPFDMIIDGHIHERTTQLGGRFIIPGSTVVTQLKKEETEPRGYVIIDTQKSACEFVPIKCRKFFFEELQFDKSSLQEVEERVTSRIAYYKSIDQGAIVKIRLIGSIREGLGAGSITTPIQELVYIDNQINASNLKDQVSKIRNEHQGNANLKEEGVRLLSERVKGRVSGFDPHELFEKLQEGPDESYEYLRRPRQVSP